MHQDRMLNAAAQYFLREIIVVKGPLPHMAQIEITIRLYIGAGIFAETCDQPVIDSPIRGVDGYVPGAIAILLQECF